MNSEKEYLESYHRTRGQKAFMILIIFLCFCGLITGSVWMFAILFDLISK